MFKKICSNQTGLTFIELMLAIAIIVMISAISVVYIKGDIIDEVKMKVDQLTADIRYTRNLAVSKTTYDFDGAGPNEAEYPSGGYGIHIDKTAGTYTIFAESGVDGYDGGDGVIKTVSLDNPSLFIGDLNEVGATSRYFTFKSENEAATNLTVSAYGKYQLEINYFTGYDNDSYRGVISLGESSDEGYVWVSLGKDFVEYIEVDSGGGEDEGEDPVMGI